MAAKKRTPKERAGFDQKQVIVFTYYRKKQRYD
jgi:hypothetical protein